MRLSAAIFLILNFCGAGLLADGGIYGEANHGKYVFEFIKNVASDDREAIARKTSFPLRREYPLPSIENREEFLKRYDEVFDSTLRKQIAASNFAKDWASVGWRGIMFGRGVVWLDIDGSLRALNYQSEAERKKRALLIEQDKSSLYPAIREFVKPTLIMETAKHRIRIDNMGENKWRYVAWPINAKMSDKPDLILCDGARVFEGSGGNHYYKFKNGSFTYQCGINVIGSDETPPAELTVYKGDRVILEENAKVLRN